MKSELLYCQPQGCSRILSVQLSHDERYISFTAGTLVMICFTETGERVWAYSLDEKYRAFVACTWTLDDRSVLLYSATGAILLLEIPGGAVHSLYQHGVAEQEDEYGSVGCWGTLSPDGQLFATCGFEDQQTIHIHDWRSGELRAVFENREPFDEYQQSLYEAGLPISNPYIYAFDWSLNGRHALIGQSYKVYMWDYQTNQIVSTHHTALHLQDKGMTLDRRDTEIDIRRCLWSSMHDLIVCIGITAIEVWTMNSERLSLYGEHQNQVINACRINNGNDLLSIGCEDVHLWDVRTGQRKDSVVLVNPQKDAFIMDMTVASNGTEVIAVGYTGYDLDKLEGTLWKWRIVK